MNVSQVFYINHFNQRNLLRNNLTCCEDIRAQCKLCQFCNDISIWLNGISYVWFTSTLAAMNAVSCNTRNKASPTPRAVLREPVLNTYKSCKCLCISEDKEDKPQHPDTLKPPVLILIRYSQLVRMSMYLSFSTFSIQTTHNCNRKKFFSKNFYFNSFHIELEVQKQSAGRILFFNLDCLPGLHMVKQYYL